MNTYPHLPIFAVTTMQHDMRIKAVRQKVAMQLGIPEPFGCYNEHKDKIVVVNSLQDPTPECDALITREKGIPLMICQADCQVGIFYDPVEKLLAVAHSGWRGSNLNIYGKMVKTMVELGSKTANILVQISPSLGPEKSEFIHYKKELHPDLWKYEHRPLYFDFWKVAEDQLLGTGITSKNIAIARVCTHTNPNFYSYRRDKTGSRDATIAMM